MWARPAAWILRCGILWSKALDVPVYRLLGGAFRDRIPCYASGLFRKDRPDNTQALMDEARGYVDQGFPAMKMKVGLGKAYDEKNVAAVRKAIGDDILLCVDANLAYDVGTAIEVGRKMEAYDLFWYEEPISRDDVAGYIEIKRALGRCGLRDVRVCRGAGLFESLSSDGRWISCNRILRLSAGLQRRERSWAMASANYIPVMPHMWGGSRWSCRYSALAGVDARCVRFRESSPSFFECDMTENGASNRIV